MTASRAAFWPLKSGSLVHELSGWRQPTILVRAQSHATLLTVVIVAAYASFIEWFWGWSAIIAQWAAVGVMPILVALALLTSTYFLRTWRILDYFPRETAGRFRTLFRVTQVHNLLNIMMPFRTGETSFPVLMRAEFGIPLTRATSALLVMRLLDLHALLAAAGIGFAAAAPNAVLAWLLWAAFLFLPITAFLIRMPLLRFGFRLFPAKAQGFLSEIENGLPANASAFARAWAMTAVNWLVKVVVLAWALSLIGRFAAHGKLRRRARRRAFIGSAGPCAGRRWHLSRGHYRRRRSLGGTGRKGGACSPGAGKHQRTSVDHRLRLDGNSNLTAPRAPPSALISSCAGKPAQALADKGTARVHRR